MSSWLLHAERLSAEPVALLVQRRSWSVRLTPRMGDGVVLVSRDKDSPAWVTHGSALIGELVSDGGGNSRDLVVRLKFNESQIDLPVGTPRSLRPVWISLSKTDQDRIKECCSSRLGTIEPISSKGARVIRNSIEFPFGNAIWLLRQHFAEVADQVLREIEFASNMKGLSRWDRALKVLEKHLHDLVVVPAYLASGMSEKWTRLAQRTNDRSSIDNHAFIGTRRGSRGGPSQITQSISVALAEEVVRNWEVRRDEKGEVKSEVLEKIFESARSEQRNSRLATMRFPEYPGSLFDEF